MDVVKYNNTQLGRTDFYGRLFSIWQSSKIKDVMAVTILLVEKRSMGKKYLSSTPQESGGCCERSDLGLLLSYNPIHIHVVLTFASYSLALQFE